MDRFVKSKDGSTTILVVVFMIVLIILGLTILTTSVSNTRLAEKKRDWLTDYYQMEGFVAEELAAFDTLLEEASNKVVKVYDGAGSLSDVYTEIVVTELEEAGYEIYDMDDVISVYIDYHNDKSDIPKHLSLELSIDKPSKVADLNNGTNFAVVSHTQWQEQFEYDEDIRFGDPFDDSTFENND